MAVILAQTANGTAGSGSTAVPFSNNTVTGNTIIVFVASSTGVTGNVSGVTDSQGNAYLKAGASDGDVIDFEIWYSAGITGGITPTVTVAYTNGLSSSSVMAREYWGLYIPSQNPFDTFTGTSGGSGNAASGNITLKQNIELLVGIAVCASSVTISAGAGFSNFATNTMITTQLAIEDQFVTSGGIQQATFTLSTNSGWGCGIASFCQVPAGTTTSTSFTTSTSISSTSVSSTSSSISTTSNSTSQSTTSVSLSITTNSTSSTSSSISSTSISSTSSSTSFSSTSTSISSTSVSSTSQSSTSSSTTISSTSTSFSSTSSSISSTSSSVSSTSFSSTSSSSSTSTTTLPPPYFDYSYQDEGSYTIVQQFAFRSPVTWLCPANVTSVFVECWGGGGGGGGADASSATACGGGGGGGAYANGLVSVTPGTSYTVSVGASGTAGAGNAVGSGGATAGGTGGSSSFNSSSVLAVGGAGGGAGNNSGAGAGGAGGLAGSSIGTVTQSGGTGGTGLSGAAGRGAGGAGSGSPGGAGTSAAPGNAGAPLGGRGGVNQANGFPPGGGAGGAGETASGGLGAAGFVQLTYTTNTSLVPTLVQSNTASSLATTVPSLTANYGSQTSRGNLLVAAAGSDDTMTMTSPGWTQAVLAIAGQAAYIWYKISAGPTESTAVTVTPGANDTVVLAIMEFSIPQGWISNPLDKTISAATSGSSFTSFSTGTSKATVQPQELVIAIENPHGTLTSAPISPTWSNGYTNIVTVPATTNISNNVALFVASNTVGSIGAQNTTGSWTNAAPDVGAALATFKISPATVPPTGNTDLANKFNAVNYGNVSVDDGDYFIERGSKYMIREYKSTHQNNIDNISMTWKGRSTLAPTISPVFIQIYNVSTGLWETLGSNTLSSADTDFQVIVTQSTNVSNYYDSTSTVTFRSYQQVV